MTNNNCELECEGGVLFSEMGEQEFCSCEKGNKAEFMAFFTDAKAKLVNKMRYV